MKYSADHFWQCMQGVFGVFFNANMDPIAINTDSSHFGLWIVDPSGFETSTSPDPAFATATRTPPRLQRRKSPVRGQNRSSSSPSTQGAYALLQTFARPTLQGIQGKKTQTASYNIYLTKTSKLFKKSFLTPPLPTTQIVILSYFDRILLKFSIAEKRGSQSALHPETAKSGLWAFCLCGLLL